MNASNKLIETYYSDDVETIKNKSKTALIIGCVLGITAVVIFGILILLTFTIIAAGFNLYIGLFMGILGMILAVPLYGILKAIFQAISTRIVVVQ